MTQERRKEQARSRKLKRKRSKKRSTRILSGYLLAQTIIGSGIAGTISTIVEAFFAPTSASAADAYAYARELSASENYLQDDQVSYLADRTPGDETPNPTLDVYDVLVNSGPGFGGAIVPYGATGSDGFWQYVGCLLYTSDAADE